MAPKPWVHDLTLHGTFNGNFVGFSAHGSGEGEGVSEWKATVTEGTFDHSTWIWGQFLHYGFAYMPDGKIKNPTESLGHRMTRHWRGEDGAHIWASYIVTGSEGAWSGDVHCVAEHFDEFGPIMKKKLTGVWPSHWVATKRSDREVDVHGLITYMVEGGGSYTAHVHDEVVFGEPCVQLTRHYWKLEYPESEYHDDRWWHKETAFVDSLWNFGPTKDKISFQWNLNGSINNEAMEASGHGYGFGFRQHQWGTAVKGFGEKGLPNLNWALAWEGHAGLHFFTRFPRGVSNPFILALPEGFTVNRKWYGQDGAHWTSTHDLKFSDGVLTKKINLVGAGFPKDGAMLATPKQPDLQIVGQFPQYVLAVPKGNTHIWYRGTFQFKLAGGNYYSGYWEMDVHFRKKVQMPSPFVVRFVAESWESDAFSWGFYEREEIEQSTYDAATGNDKRQRAMTGSIEATALPPPPLYEEGETEKIEENEAEDEAASPAADVALPNGAAPVANGVDEIEQMSNARIALSPPPPSDQHKLQTVTKWKKQNPMKIAA